MRRARYGFTLIEVLAVTALLGLITSVLVGSGLRTTGHGTAATLRQMFRWEANVRDLARERGGCTLSWDDAGIMSGRTLTGQTLTMPPSPAGILACQDGSGQSLRTIRIDLNGFSPSYAWLVAAPDDQRLVMVVDGLTGAVSRGEAR